MGKNQINMESETMHEYQTQQVDDDNRRSNISVKQQRVHSQYSGNSLGGAVAPPSLNNFKLKVRDELRQSHESNQNPSGLSGMIKPSTNKRQQAFQTSYKVV